MIGDKDQDPWGKAMREAWADWDGKREGIPTKTLSADEMMVLYHQDNKKSEVAVKHDQDKIQMELIPPELLIEVGKVLTFGATKYAPRNWEKGMDWSRAYGALLRHMMAFWGGENKDPESGLDHLSHAACCLTFLIAYNARGTGNDNRVQGEGE